MVAVTKSIDPCLSSQGRAEPAAKAVVPTANVLQKRSHLVGKCKYTISVILKAISSNPEHTTEQHMQQEP